MTQRAAPAQTVVGLNAPDENRAEVDSRRQGKGLPGGVEILDPGYEAREDLSDLCVLIVDSNPLHRTLVCDALYSKGIWNLWEANDVAEAEKILTEKPVDLIIIDNDMTGENGIDFTRRLRQGEASGNRCMPIIMVTSDGGENIIHAARDAGVHEYILKPFDNTALIKRVQLTFKIPRDFIISPGYVGPDRRWKQKLKAQQVYSSSNNGAPNHASARMYNGGLPPWLGRPEVLICD